MPQTTTNFGWTTSLTAEAQFAEVWADQYNVVFVNQDTEMFKTKIKGKETIFIPASAMIPTASNGCNSLTSVETTAGNPDMIVLDYDTAIDSYSQFQIAFPKSWDEGTVTFIPQWTTSSTGGGAVQWELEGVAVSDDGTIDVAYGTSQSSVDTALGTAEDLHTAPESSAITIAGTPAEGDMCYFRMARKGTLDTHASAARLIGIKVFFTTDGRSDD